MRLCTLLWFIRRNAFFLVYSGRGKCDFSSSLTVHLLLLIAGIGLLFCLVYKSKEYQTEAWSRQACDQFSTVLKCIATEKNMLINLVVICSSSYPMVSNQSRIPQMQ